MIPKESDEPIITGAENYDTLPAEESGPEICAAESTAPGKKKWGRRVILAALILLGAYLLFSVVSVFMTPDRRVQQIYLIPADAAFIIHSSEPVSDWKKFSASEPWKALSRSANLSDVAADVERLDSIVRNNKMLLSLVGRREMMVSIHKKGQTQWDWLAVVDLQKISKMGLVKDQVETIGSLAGYDVSNRKYRDVNIFEMRDRVTRDILYLAFVDNHVAFSYTASLLNAAIDARENPVIGLDEKFMEAEKLVSGKGMFRVFVNYSVLPEFMSIYLSQGSEMLDIFSGSMDFAGMWMDTANDRMEVNGYTLANSSADPYVAALLNSGGHRMKAHDIMSARTALYINVGFRDVGTFLGELEKAMSAGDSVMYNAYINSRVRIEKYFDLSLQDNFLGWMSGEFAFAQAEPGSLGREPEVILAIRANSIKAARTQMELVEKQVKRRSPVKVKSVDYNGFEINYIEMKGFFRLFFGGLFDRFEKPYYSYVGDYVVFSNKSSALLSFIEDFRQGNILSETPPFKRALSRSQSASTMFAYADVARYYPILSAMLNNKTRAELEHDRDILLSFPSWQLQVSGSEKRARMHFVADYKPYEEVGTPPADIDEDDPAMKGDAESKKELMNELKRFHVEKFEGNVLREFYDDGRLKSETEVRDGERHGRHREFFEDGTMAVRGKYVKGKPRGTWKYYTAEGEFDHKEKY